MNLRIQQLLSTLNAVKRKLRLRGKAFYFLYAESEASSATAFAEDSYSPYPLLLIKTTVPVVDLHQRAAI